MKRLASLVLLCTISLAAHASLVSWVAGDPGTTRQVWSFDTNTNPALPEIDENQYGDAVAAISNTINPTAYSWSNGVWSGTAFSLTIDIPNNPVANPYKEVVVEVIYQGQIVLNWVMDSDWNDFENTFSCDADLGNGWIKRTDIWRIEPNPSSERVCYGFRAETGAVAAVDTAMVETICVPEPATLAFLGLTAIFARKRK